MAFGTSQFGSEIVSEKKKQYRLQLKSLHVFKPRCVFRLQVAKLNIKFSDCFDI